MRVVVVGAGLGGLGCALRLQGAGHDVVVVEQKEQPGGRADQIVDGGFTWDTGPSLITMPWVLEDTFAAGGMDLWSELSLHRLDPLYGIHWAQDDRSFHFTEDLDRLRDEIARFSVKDAGRLDAFVAALKPIYEQGIVGAGRRDFGSPGPFVQLLPMMLRLRAAEPLSHFVGRFFEHPRVREAFSFHSLFIGGDPFRVPAIYGALVYLQLLDGGWYAEGGVFSLVQALARPLDVRCGDGVEAIETDGTRVSGVRLRGGERIPADAVVANTDVLTLHELLGRRKPVRPLRETMSCFLLYLGTDRTFTDKLDHHTLLVGDHYRDFIRTVTRGPALPQTFSTYVHAPARTEPGMATPGGDSICVLLPVPNLRDAPQVDWATESDRLRDALVRDMEDTFGLTGLDAAVRVEHRMDPTDFRDTLGAKHGNAFALEPTLHQSAFLRPHNRDRGVTGLYRVGGGTHPGAGIPGVLLGAEVTAGLVNADFPARTRVGAR